MSDPSFATDPLSTAEMVRFARSHSELVNRTRALAERHERYERLAQEADVPYAWIREFVANRGKHHDITRVCKLFLVLVGEQASN